MAGSQQAVEACSSRHEQPTSNSNYAHEAAARGSKSGRAAICCCEARGRVEAADAARMAAAAAAANCSKSVRCGKSVRAARCSRAARCRAAAARA